MRYPPPAIADYFGLEVVERTDLTICQDPSEPDIPFKLDVCDIHVVFDDPADRLISVAFTNVSTTAPQGFFQHPLGVNTAPPCAFIPLVPTLVCDSFVTLGVECDGDGNALDPDFDGTAFNSSGEVRGGWFNSNPIGGQGVPDANGRVMIARFSYKQNKNTSGDVCVFTKLAGSKDISAFLLQPFDCAVPGGGLPAGGGGGGTICYVDDDGDEAANCTSWNDACPDLQTALAPAKGCTEIRVAQGTYRPADSTGIRTETFQLFDDLTLKGGYAGIGASNPDLRKIDDFETILSGDRLDNDVEDLAGFFECYSGDNQAASGCVQFDQNADAKVDLGDGNLTENSYHVVTMSGTSNVVLDGFTISQGVANLNVPLTGVGAGIHGEGTTSAQILNCTVHFNYATCTGGGAALGGAPLATPLKIDGCIFDHNISNLGGGGLSTGGDLEIHACQFTKNRVTDGLFLRGVGGGLKVFSTGENDNVLITTSRFADNEAARGGGVFITARYPEFVNCTFANNSAALFGGGAVGASRQIDDPSENLSFTNCLFANHTFEAVAMSCVCGVFEHGIETCDPIGLTCQLCEASQDVESVNCTFYNNGLTIDTDRDVTLKSVLMWEAVGVNAGGTCDVSYSNIEGGATAAGCTDVAGNIGELPAHEPTFFDADGPDNIPGTSDDDFRTTSGSPGNDAGDNLSVPVGVVEDLSGAPRISNDPGAVDTGNPEEADAHVDMGAYEYACNECVLDANGDGNIRAFDLAILLGCWGPNVPGNGICFCADANGDGRISAADLAELLGSWGPCP